MSKRYAKPSPRIADKGRKSEGTEHTDTKPREHADTAPKGSSTSGTDRGDMTEQPIEQVHSVTKDTKGQQTGSATLHEEATHEGEAGLPVHARHLAERKEMHARHAVEQGSMHERHHEEHKKMSKRHEEEIGSHHEGQG